MTTRDITIRCTFKLWTLLAVIFASWMMGATHVFAKSIAGAYVHIRDSDGTVPKSGAIVTITLKGGATGSIALLATQPEETVTDTGTYSIQGNRITIHFKEVEWEAKNQPFQFDGCTLILPFKALGSTAGPGTSSWKKQDTKCGTDGLHARIERETKVPLKPFSADGIIIEGKQRRKVKVYAMEKALRGEREENGQRSITIIRFDRNVMWTLEPQKKFYTETFLNVGGEGIILSQGNYIEPGCSVVGEEQVGSYHCLKKLCRIRIEGKDYSETRWAAKELGGLIIKYTDSDRTIELENINLGPQDTALFEIPVGYQKRSR